MTRRRTVDVAHLDRAAFGNAGLIWWGTVGFMVIEGSMFVMAIIVYFYLRLRVEAWPPSLPDPSLGPGTINVILVILSAFPNALAKRAGERLDLRGVHLWLAVLTAFGAVALVLRAFEYGALNCRWDDNAYASMVWLLLSLHTIHLATDVVDGAVLLALMVKGPTPKQRFVDVSENSLYWYFIVGWWIPIYVTIYWVPRWL
jgi:heme/copper-type cytochrome/quinol oxidase subunit 3